MRRLERLAATFADDLSDLLNKTITRGVRVSTLVTTPGYVVAGRNVTKQRMVPERIAVKTGGGAAVCFLELVYTLGADTSGHLTVVKSKIGVYSEAEGRQLLVHYDYNREPDYGYPDPHVQVDGDCPALAELYERAPGDVRRLHEVHFPVGARWFRPAVEDVIRMLVAEGLVTPHQGWEAVVEKHERVWREKQVGVTVRRFPDVAASALRGIGFRVEGPGRST